MLTTTDFKELGLGLADARLLIEKYRCNNRADELASLVEAVRSKKDSGKGKQRKKKKNIKVDYNWYHWCCQKRKFTLVKLDSGGGRRTYEWERESTLEKIFEHMKETFFPNGRSKKGRKFVF